MRPECRHGSRLSRRSWSALKLDVIVTPGNPASLAAKQATSTIPIVTASADPVGAGLVHQPDATGREYHGVQCMSGPEFDGKATGAPQGGSPGASRVACSRERGVRPAAGTSQSRRRPPTRSTSTLATCSGQSRRLHSRLCDVGAGSGSTRCSVLRHSTSMTHRHGRRPRLEHRLPAMYAFRESVEAGGLMALRRTSSIMYRRTAGTSTRSSRARSRPTCPSSSPPSSSWSINLKTAKALGLTIPPSLLLRADQVIE